MAFGALVLAAASSCATLEPQQAFAGRPITDAVAQLGVPHAVADDVRGARYFTWSTSDVIVLGQGGDNPENWLRPRSPREAPADKMHAARPEDLPYWTDRWSFDAGRCTLTLVAQWDEVRQGWVATETIRKGAGPGGRCGARASI